MNNLSY